MLTAAQNLGLGNPPTKGLAEKELLVYNWADFAKRVPAMLKANEHVAVLEFIAHGGLGTGFLFGNRIGLDIQRQNAENLPVAPPLQPDTSQSASMTKITTGNVGWFTTQLNGLNILAKRSLIILNGCNVGNAKFVGNIVETIANGTGSLVLAPGGFSSGTFAAGNEKTTRTYDERDAMHQSIWGKTFYQVLPAAERAKYRDSESDCYYLTVPGNQLPQWLNEWAKKYNPAKQE